jgi:hypothetical protein
MPNGPVHLSGGDYNSEKESWSEISERKFVQQAVLLISSKTQISLKLKCITIFTYIHACLCSC